MNKIINTSYKDLVSQREIFIKENDIIKNFSLSAKGRIKKVLNNPESPIDTYITLCPFYDGNGGISGNYDNFDDVGIRYQNKLNASLEVLNFLKDNFNLKIKFLLADKGIMLDDSYNYNNFNNDIDNIKEIYNSKIISSIDNFELTTFTELGLNMDDICNTSEVIENKKIFNLLEDYGVDINKFNFSLDIIKNAFGNTGAYYLIKNYLSENKQLIEKYEDIIFLNTEACSPLNSLYKAGDYKIDSKNIFARVDINS